jgi:hypothetical protein
LGRRSPTLMVMGCPLEGAARSAASRRCYANGARAVKRRWFATSLAGRQPAEPDMIGRRQAEFGVSNPFLPRLDILPPPQRRLWNELAERPLDANNLTLAKPS